MQSSIFLKDTNSITFEDIKSFCAQGFSEGTRIEYKREFPKNLGLVETICAFANTQGGIILVGIEADERKNIPTQISGIELKNGLEEKVINLCLSHIAPTIVPEVKICDFKTDSKKPNADRAVILIKVKTSDKVPHYLLENNEIKIRVHNRNCLADLRTIESLINRREKQYPLDSLDTVTNDYKSITVENNVFETVIIVPKFQGEEIIDFYNKENCDWLFRTANEVIQLNEKKPQYWRLKFIKSNSSDEIVNYCNIEKIGSVKFQRPVDLEGKKYFPFWSLDMVVRSLKTIKKIYSHYNFFSDVAVGLTISNTKGLELGIFDYRLAKKYVCQDNSIKISKTAKFDELLSPNQILQEMFKEICVHFGAVFPEKNVIKKIDEVLKTD